jgi:hypothetical protein
MLNELFAKKPTRYLALPLLGAVADDFDTWLATQGYRRRTRRQQARALVRIDRDLRRQGHRQWGTLRAVDLETCWTRHRRRHPNTAATARVLLRFLQATSRLPVAPPAVTRIATLAKIYGATLEDLRGLTRATIEQHVTTAEDFLAHLDYELQPERLAALTASDVEAFVRGVGKRHRAPGLRQSDRHPARLSPGAAATQSAVADRPGAVAIH